MNVKTNVIKLKICLDVDKKEKGNSKTLKEISGLPPKSADDSLLNLGLCVGDCASSKGKKVLNGVSCYTLKGKKCPSANSTGTQDIYEEVDLK